MTDDEVRIARAGLYRNGAADPRRWAPAYGDCRATAFPQVGQLVAMRYAAWRVMEVRRFDDADLTAEQLAELDQRTRLYKADVRAQQREMWRPGAIVLCHERGPFLIRPDEPSQRLHDGRRTVHWSIGRGRAQEGAAVRAQVLDEIESVGLWALQAIEDEDPRGDQPRPEVYERLNAMHRAGVARTVAELATRREATGVSAD